ncbi:MAG TPA: hypothetical protein VFE18_01440 [Phenylobacterium sp.]|jgi:hypothetical protein|uniref:CC0125/CC1285 family lipoprotein n=1 Tax=Phenylobacterium sp. TaxID=1871053 RepID=UPI002D500284|nr:hypothetical protein [Phenylobacterium sp.]HZZ66812.1 hypothetical protein [Phenylobacterium sp.]
MTKIAFRLLTLILAAGLCGCISPTPYQAAIHGGPNAGGYSELRIEPDRWRVTFAGNAVTSRETVEGYLLFRAAEVTLQNGGDWFMMVDRQTDRDARTYVQPDPLYHPWYGPRFDAWRPVWRYRRRASAGWRTWDPLFGDPFWADAVNVQTVQSFEASAEIVTHRGAKPADDPRAFDAHAVVETLKPKILYPTAKP